MLSDLFGIIPIKEIAALSQLITLKEARIARLPWSSLSPTVLEILGHLRGSDQRFAELYTCLSL